MKKMISLRKIYFIDILSILSRNILFTVAGLISLGLINQVNLIMSVGLKSSNLHVKILKLCLYLTPYLLSTVLPFSVLIGIILLMSRYRKENKIIALQNLGIGPNDLRKPLYLVGLIVVIINYWLYFFISPSFYKEFKDLQIEMRNQSVSDLIEPHVLKNYGNGMAIYIESKDEQNNLRGIFISDTRDKNSIKSFVAKSGKISSNGIELIDGTYYENSTKGSSFIQFKNYLLTIKCPEKITNSTDPYSMSIYELYKGGFVENNFKVQSVIHQKITWPLYSILFIIVCFNLEWYFSYKSYSRIGSKIWVSVLVCIIIAAAHFLIQNLSVKLPILGSGVIYLFIVVVCFIMTNFNKS